MSLQLWMPLMGDLRNQGLGSYSISTLGTLSWVSGKLGSQAMRAGDGTQIVNGVRIENTFTELLNGNYSVSVWLKPYGTHVHYNGSVFSSGNWNTANKRWAFGVSQNNTKVDVLCMNYNTYINCTVPANEWTHIVCARGSDDKVKLYKNGEYIGERDCSSDPTFDSDATFSCIGRESYASGYFSFNGAIQDFRLYDHCLSPMEVKQLSQGLILHYPLNRQGWGQENILLNSASEKTGASNSAQWFRWNTNATLTANQTYTLSFDAKMTIATDVFYISWSNNDSTQEVWNQGTQVTTEYKRYSFTGSTTKTNINAILMSNYKGYNRGNNNNTTGVLSVKNIKLELGSIATPWCPNSADDLYTSMGLNGATEYDCSGFCNNGTKNNITYTSDTPKYAVSSIFNGSNSYIKVNDNNWMVKGMSEMTVNLWAKATTWPTNGGRLVSCTESGGFNLEAGNSGYWRFPIYVYTNSGQTSSAYKYDSNEIKIADLTPDEWNMITLVYDSTGTKTYLNGELHHTYTNTSYGINFNTNARLFLGCEANTASPYTPYFNGKECDFRIYATALSASDVKSLYQNCATIDPDGTIRGQIRS